MPLASALTFNAEIISVDHETADESYLTIPACLTPNAGIYMRFECRRSPDASHCQVAVETSNQLVNLVLVPPPEVCIEALCLDNNSCRGPGDVI